MEGYCTTCQQFALLIERAWCERCFGAWYGLDVTAQHEPLNWYEAIMRAGAILR